MFQRAALHLLAVAASVLVLPTLASAQPISASQLEVATGLVNAQGAPSKTAELEAIVKKMSPRQQRWLGGAIDRYQELKGRADKSTPFGSLRTDLPDGRWAWQIVAGPRTVTMAVKRTGRACVTSIRTPRGDNPEIGAPFTLSQAAAVKLADAQKQVKIAQWGDLNRVKMQGVVIPQWNAFGKPSTRADFRQQPRPVSQRKLKK